MEFIIPRLRVKLAQIVQRYSDFIRKPTSFLAELSADIEEASPELGAECARLLAASSYETPPILELDAFVNNLKLFLASSSINNLNTNNELMINKPISELHGIGAKTAVALGEFGLHTIKDVICSLPFRYEVIGDATIGTKGVLKGIYEDSAKIFTKNRKPMFQAVFRYPKGFVYGIWLHFQANFPSSLLKKGEKYNLYGSITSYNGSPAIFHPELLDDIELGTIRPIYPLPAKVAIKTYQKAVHEALTEYLPYFSETLPEKIRYKYRYPDIQDSFNTLHNPGSAINVDLIMERKHPAIERLIYEELFYLQLRLLLKKSYYAEARGIEFKIPREMLDEITPLMPFRLTSFQRDTLREIFANMRKQAQMNRLLQGDVGSGKTILAFISALVAVKNGYQAVILAPTEVLAEQHYHNLNAFLKGTGYFSALLTGSVKAKDKRDIKDAIKHGDIQFIVGTHALIQEDVEFHKLGFAVIDEQHKFGVKQRKALMDKGGAPDVLLMTATPIPRTLALTYYGDLELSEITGMPPGRIPPITKVYKERMLQSAFKFINDKLKNGERAYFVYPAIEDSEASNLKSVSKNFEVIKKVFPSKKVGLLHGKMKADEKSQILHAFNSGGIDILVSTTVVEVGVDVKDATIILIENADRFGLAQLHQLRGRVGRNDKQSYCLLVASDTVSETGWKRLQAMEEHTDGFKLAEIDLELRGHGDFFGVKQSGVPEFQFADIIRDSAILKEARRDAEEIISADTRLESSANSLIRSVLMQRWRDEYELFLVG